MVKIIFRNLFGSGGKRGTGDLGLNGRSSVSGKQYKNLLIGKLVDILGSGWGAVVRFGGRRSVFRVD